MAALGHFCCMWAFSNCNKQGLHFFEVHGAPTAVASLVVELRLQASVVLAHRLSCSEACGVFLDQRSNLCPLHWQADS